MNRLRSLERRLFFWTICVGMGASLLLGIGIRQWGAVLLLGSVPLAFVLKWQLHRILAPLSDAFGDLERLTRGEGNDLKTFLSGLHPEQMAGFPPEVARMRQGLIRLKRHLQDRFESEQRVMERLRGAAEQAQAAEIASRKRFASVRRELEGPLHALCAVLADSEQCGPPECHCMYRVTGLVEELRFVVESLRDPSERDSHLQTSRFALEELLAEVQGRFMKDATEKGVFLRSEIAPEVPLHLVGHPARLRQVLYHLLRNAVTATEKSGTVALRVRQASTDGNTHTLEFVVTDSGPGVPEPVRPHLFDADPEVHSGAGLFISRELVRQMGGDIRYRPPEGGGAEFGFRVACGVPETVST